MPKFYDFFLYSGHAQGSESGCEWSATFSRICWNLTPPPCRTCRMSFMSCHVCVCLPYTPHSLSLTLLPLFFARHIYLPLPRCRYCCGSVAVAVVAFVSSTNKISAINIRLPMRQRVNMSTYVCVSVCVCAESYVLCLLPFFIASFAPFVLWLWVRAFVYIFASLRHFTTFSSFLWNLFSLPTRQYPMNIDIQFSSVRILSYAITGLQLVPPGDSRMFVLVSSASVSCSASVPLCPRCFLKLRLS